MNNAYTSVLDQLINEVQTAFTARKRLIMIDTYEKEVVRDIAYHPRNPVAHITNKLPADSGDKLLNLLQDKEASYANTENVVWYNSGGTNSKETLPDVPTIEVIKLVPEAVGRKSARSVRENAAAIAHLRDYTDGVVLGRFAAPSFKLIYGSIDALPEDLSRYTQIIDVGYPNIQEIRDRIRRKLESAHFLDAIGAEGSEVQASFDRRVDTLAQDMRGFTYVEVDDLMDYLLNDYVERDGKRALIFWDEEECRKAIIHNKEQFLKRSGTQLELIPESSAKIAGMERFRSWVRENRSRIFAPTAHEYALHVGLTGLKGILMHGVRGCAKSDAVKLLQQEWGIPVIKLTIGNLMGSLLGQSERQMRKALRQAEAFSPCILFIDEIDKDLSGTSAGEKNGNDAIKRMFAHLLSWMSGKRNGKTVFVYATANSLTGLPAELFRKGRFNILFSVSMPTKKECADIFLAQLEHLNELARTVRREDGLADRAPYSIFKDAQLDRSEIEKLVDGNGDASIPSLLHPKPGKKPLFATGADIFEIVQLALFGCAAPKLENSSPDSDGLLDLVRKNMRKFPINLSEFIENAQKVISSDTISTTGYGTGNLKSIARDYLNTLRSGFVPASDDAEVYFTMDEYDEVLEEANGFARLKVQLQDSERAKKYAMGSAESSAYDQELYAILRKFIEAERIPS